FAPASALAVIALGRALQIRNGFIDPDALLWLTIAFALVAGAAVTPRALGFARFDARAVRAIALTGLLIDALQLYTALPGLDMPLQPGSLGQFYRGVTVLVVMGAVLLLPDSRRWTKPLLVGGFVAVHFTIGVWLIRHAPNPHIDVYAFQRRAIWALRHGRDP